VASGPIYILLMHVRDCRDAELVQEMRDLCESHAAYSKGIVCGIGRGLGSRLLFSRSPVDCSSEGDDQSTCRFIVIQASSIVRIDITSKCACSFSSECTFYKCSSECSSECSTECSSECSSECFSETQSPVLRAVEVPKHALESYHMLIDLVKAFSLPEAPRNLQGLDADQLHLNLLSSPYPISR